jgi:hypothetical protein
MGQREKPPPGESGDSEKAKFSFKNFGRPARNFPGGKINPDTLVNARFPLQGDTKRMLKRNFL